MKPSALETEYNSEINRVTNFNKTHISNLFVYIGTQFTNKS